MSQARTGALSSGEVEAALAGLPGWRQSGKALERGFVCAGFLEAMALLNQVAAIAQRLDHHPDMRIEFKKVRFTLSSHDAGGITARDLALAREIDGAAAAAGAAPRD
jgi:4a-hydroxytetrahydrobiopterin dehydratase